MVQMSELDRISIDDVEQACRLLDTIEEARAEKARS
jgi:hypothetical protein